MTPPSPQPEPSPPPHLDLDALADALADQGGAAGAEHLAACRSCASRLDELAVAESRVVAVLRGLPAPALPDGLADRLSTALSAESPLRPGTAGVSGSASTGASVTALPAARSRPRRTWLPAAAAAVLLASGAGLGLALVGDGLGDSSSDETASTAGGLADRDAATPDLLLTSSGADWADPAAGTGALPQVLSGAAAPVELEGESPAEESGPDTGGGSGDDAAPEVLSVPDGLAALRTREGLQACLSSVLPPDEPGLLPLAVDYASYDGEPALAVVLPDPDPSQVAVYVVGAGCSAEDDQTLFFLRAPRP